FLCILSSHDIALDILIRSKRISNRPSSTIVRRQNEDVTFVGSLGNGQVGFCQTLGSVEIPVSSDLSDDLTHLIAAQLRLVLQTNRFAGILDHEGAIRNLRLENFPGAFKEQ